MATSGTVTSDSAISVEVYDVVWRAGGDAIADDMGVARKEENGG
jgi:hypothetical protein